MTLSRTVRSRKVQRGLTYAGAIVMALWIIIPIYLIGAAAFTPRSEIYTWPKPLIQTKWSMETMLFFWNSKGVQSSVVNSIVVALLTLAGSMLIGAPAGYALARYQFPGRDIFRIIVVSTRAFPIVILSVPLAVSFITLGLYDTLISVALMHIALALPFTILVTSSVFAGVPKELEEAAMTMGCNRMQAFMKISLPLTLPGLAAAAIFTFVISWNEVFAAVILTLQNRTLPAQVLSVLNESPIPFRFAGGFFLLIPSLIFMLFIRRYLFNLWGSIATK